MSSGKSHDPLQDYFDSLLNDSPRADTPLAAPARLTDEAALKFAAGNIAPLPNAPRPLRAVAARAYAEPIRTLNLRMPLPPIAPPLETAPPEPPQVDQEAPVQTIPAPAPAPAAEPAAGLVETVIEPETDVWATMAVPPPWLANGRPQWAQQPFECLLFKAGGLQLAAPLVELGSIYPLAEEGLTAIFGQTQWFLGLLPVKEYNVRAMDTALVVMPERYNASMRDRYRYVVTLFGSDWGLAVDAVIGTVLLDPDHIRWRGERSKRPWLAGTLIDQMCALFDIAQLAWLFHNQDRKRAAH